MRRWSSIVAYSSLFVCLAALGLVPAGTAEEPKTNDKAKVTADDAQEFVFLGEARPLLIRMRTRTDGQPVRVGWDDFVKYLFTYLDVNGDAILSKEEAERAPSIDRLFNAGLGSIGGIGGIGRAPAGPTPDTLDADKDGKVTKDELAAYYRKNGLAPFQFQIGPAPANPLGMAAGFLGGSRGEPSVEAVSEGIFTLLDADKNGQLTKEELAAAPTVLLRLDEDEDEIVTTRELVPNARPAGGMQMLGLPQGPSTAAGKSMLVPITAQGEVPADLVRRMQERYGLKVDNPAEKKLSRKDLGLDEVTFGQLDTNSDGVLDATELAGFVKRLPDLELIMRLGKKAAAESAVEAVTTGNRASPVAGKIKAQDSLALLDLGVTRLEIRGGEEERPDAFSGIVRQQYLAQLKQADGNNDGVIDENEASKNRLFRGLFKAVDRDSDNKITEKELNAYLDQARELQTRAEAACVALALADQSRGLFDLLDVNRDGRLGVRELRGAAQLLQQLDRDGKGHLIRADIPRTYQLTLRRGPVNAGGLGGLGAFAALYGGSSQYEPDRPTTAGPDWFRKMDRNRDGDVSRKEFLFAAERFRAIDTDSDGLISAVEAERYDAMSRERK